VDEKSSPADAGKAVSAKHEKPKAIALDNSGNWLNITDDHRNLWNSAYPAVNLDSELPAAAAWIIANPANRKSNYLRYLTNWLKRSQDKAPRVGGSAPATQRSYI